MRNSILHKVQLGLVVLAVAFVTSESKAQTPERCSVGETLSAFQAFYPAIFTVNEFTVDQNGQVIWITIRGGGLGQGVVNCQFRLFAASQVSAGPALPDTYSFCSNDLFFGGNAISFPYTNPDARAYLDAFYADVKGSYQQKAKADLDLLTQTVELKRETYYDASGTERTVGDGGPDDPALSDTTAGDPKPQDVIVTNYRGAKDGSGQKLIYRHDGFFAQLEAGRYHATTNVFFDGFQIFAFDPVELNIVDCD